MKVHPLAELFPMDDDDLDALAADIAANGQRLPVIVDPDGVLLDGRRRSEACRRIGREPEAEVYDGDPVALIVSLNVERRHLSAGQRAVIAAQALRLDSSASGRKRGVGQAAERIGVHRQRIAEATLVLDHAPELAPHVVEGLVLLADAHAIARMHQHDAEYEEPSPDLGWAEECAALERDGWSAPCSPSPATRRCVASSPRWVNPSRPGSTEVNGSPPRPARSTSSTS